MKGEMILGGSVSCFDLYNLRRQMEDIARAPIDFLHYDVVDGRFNRCIILGLPLLKALRPHTRLPIEVHMAVYEPERYIEQFAGAGADIISIHPEGTRDLAGAFDLIRRCGAKPALALRSESEVPEAVLEVAEQAEYIVKLTVDPGFSGQKIQTEAFARMKSLRQALDERGIHTPIAADGNVNADTIPALVGSGADMLIGGTSGLFRRESTAADCAKTMLEAYHRAKEART